MFFVLKNKNKIKRNPSTLPTKSIQYFLMDVVIPLSMYFMADRKPNLMPLQMKFYFLWLNRICTT